MKMTVEMLNKMFEKQNALQSREAKYEQEHSPENRNLTGFLLTADGGVVASLTGDLDDFYRVLECDCFDIATRKIGGKYFDIFVDDEGLLKDNPRPSAVDTEGHVMLVGNLFICTNDDEGNSISISREDIKLIMDSVGIGVNSEGDVIPVLTQVDY